MNFLVKSCLQSKSGLLKSKLISSFSIEHRNQMQLKIQNNFSTTSKSSSSKPTTTSSSPISSSFSNSFSFSSRLFSTSSQPREPSVQTRNPYVPTLQFNQDISNEKRRELVDLACKNVGIILNDCLQFKAEEKLLVVHDRKSPLASILTDAYIQFANNNNLSNSVKFIEFNVETKEEVINAIDQLKPSDCVVMIQSENFLLDKYRIRIELFKRQLKTADHVHLWLMSSEQLEAYIGSLSFSPKAQQASIGRNLKQLIDKASNIVIRGADGCELHYETKMEPTLLNLGDYTGMKNVGGTFPVGEVFSEAVNFDGVNGKVKVWAYPNMMRYIESVPDRSKLFEVTIEKGYVTNVSKDAPKAFVEVLEAIKESEGPVLVREFGLGLNDKIGKPPTKLVNDMTAFERQQGLHLSLGKKHNVFKKPQIQGKLARFHIDMFVEYEEMKIDGKSVIQVDNSTGAFKYNFD